MGEIRHARQARRQVHVMPEAQSKDKKQKLTDTKGCGDVSQ
jgi:hypothetical protein